MLAGINYWTNSQVTIDYTGNDARVVGYYDFRITNMKFALVTRGFTHLRLRILSGILDKQFSS